jgi:hypothetical protein
MKKFECVAVPTKVGTVGYWKVEAENQKEAMSLFQDKAIEHIESFDDVAEIEEESGFEYEYNYFVQEISDDDYEKLELDNLI